MAAHHITFEAAALSATLLDFGLRRALAEASSPRWFEQDVDLWDTFAPEVWRGDPATPATDQYALAAVAYELICGQRLLKTQNLSIAKDFLASAHLESVGGLPDHTLRALERALAASPEERFPDCEEFVRKLLEEEADASAVPKYDDVVPLKEVSPPQDTAPEPYDPSDIFDPDSEIVIDFGEPHQHSVIDEFDGSVPPVSESIAQEEEVVPPPLPDNRREDKTVPGDPHVDPASQSEVTTRAQPKRHRKGVLHHVATLVMVAAMLSIPAGLWYYRHAEVLTLAVKAQDGVAPKPVIVPDAMLEQRRSELDALANQAKERGFDKIATDRWSALSQRRAKAEQLLEGNDLQAFLSAAGQLVGEYEEAIDLTQRHKVHLAVRRPTAKVLSGEDPGELDRVRQTLPVQWKRAEQSLADADELAAKYEYDRADEILETILPRLQKQLGDAYARAAASTEQAPTATNRLDLLASAFVAGHKSPESDRFFAKTLATKPDWLISRYQAELVSAEPSSQALGYCEVARAQHSTSNSAYLDTLRKASSAALAAPKGEDRDIAIERVLEVAFELEERTTAAALLKAMQDDTISTASAAMRIAGYALAADDETSWLRIAASACELPGAGYDTVVEALAVAGRYTGDFGPALDLTRELRGEATLAIAEIALAASEAGNREACVTALGRLEESTRELREELRSYGDAYTLATLGLLGEAAALEAPITQFPPEIQDFIGSYRSRGFARMDRFDQAQATHASVSHQLSLRCKASAEVAASLAKNDPEAMGLLVRQALVESSASDRSATLAWCYAGLSGEAPASSASRRSPSVEAQRQADGPPRRFVGEVVNGDTAKQAFQLVSAKNPRQGSPALVVHLGSQPTNVAVVTSAIDSRYAISREVSPVQPLNQGDVPAPKEFLAINPGPFAICFRAAAGQGGGDLRVVEHTDTKPAELSKDFYRSELKEHFFQWLITPRVGSKAKRWKNERPLGVQVIGDSEHRATAAKVVREIAAALPKGPDLVFEKTKYTVSDWDRRVFERAARNANFINLFLGPVEQHEDYAMLYEPYGVKGWPRNKTSHNVYLADNYSYGVCVAMVDDSSDDEEQQSRLIAAEMLRVLGLGRQGVYPLAIDSVLASGEPKSQASSSRTLSKLDREMLQFYYTQCQLGDSLHVMMTKFSNRASK